MLYFANTNADYSFQLTNMRWLSPSMLLVINAISKSRYLSLLHTFAMFPNSILTKSEKMSSLLDRKVSSWH